MGQRVLKEGPSGTTSYVRKMYECAGGSCTRYIFAGDKRIASVDASGTIRYFHADHLGSTRAVTNAPASLQPVTVLEKIAYHPFGSVLSDDAPAQSHHKFTSQESDPESGLYFFNARYYDPSLGRFITPDPSAPVFGDAQSLNRYGYAANNPLRYTDPSGLDIFDELANFLADSFRGGIYVSASNQGVEVSTGEPAMFDPSGIAADGISSPNVDYTGGGLTLVYTLGHRPQREWFFGAPPVDANGKPKFIGSSVVPNFTGMFLSFYDRFVGDFADNAIRHYEETGNTTAATLAKLGHPDIVESTIGVMSLASALGPRSADPAAILQRLTTEANEALAANPALARALLSPKELAAAQQSSRIAPMAYGNAVERYVAQLVQESSEHSSMFLHVGGAFRPDFVGVGRWAGMTFDITTPPQVARHLLRPYGPGLNVCTYVRPVGFTF